MKKTDFRARLDRIAHKMLDIAGAILDSMERRDAPATPLTPAEAAAFQAPWRWTNDQFRIWTCCASRRCRRARRCRGEPQSCLERHLPSVPQPARERVRRMLRARFALAPGCGER